MENNKISSSLQQKLQLLKTLRQGKLEESEKLLANLSTTSRTNPALYQKFHSFLSQNRSGIEQIQNQERDEQPKTVLVEGSDEEWLTDDSVSIPSQEDSTPQHEEEDTPQQQSQEGTIHTGEEVGGGQKRLMKNVSNTKSTILLHGSKEAKRPFLVQTKPKQGSKNATIKPRGSSVTKIENENKSLLSTLSKSNLTTLSKSNLLAKALTKQPSKPYFPPINSRNPTLKLK